MARITYEYKYYKHSPMATRISKFGHGVAPMLTVLGVIFAIAGISNLIREITVDNIVAFGIGAVLTIGGIVMRNCDEWAEKIAKRDFEKMLQKMNNGR